MSLTAEQVNRPDYLPFPLVDNSPASGSVVNAPEPDIIQEYILTLNHGLNLSSLFVGRQMID